MIRSWVWTAEQMTILQKPFGMMEFIARVRAVLRRAGKEEKENDVLETGDLQIQVKQHQVLAKGEKVTLTLKEFELLKFFNGK